MREQIALPDGRALLGAIVTIDEDAPRAYTAVSSRPCCLTAMPVSCDVDGEKTARRWFFPAQPISISQNRALAQQGEFVVLLDDGGVWRCSFAVKRDARPNKRAKSAKGKASSLSFAIETDNRSQHCPSVSTQHSQSSLF